MVNDDVVAPRPPLPPNVFSPTEVTPPNLEGTDQDSSQESDSPQAAASTPTETGQYAIVVASFTSRERAERLVEELMSAGYRAHAVERDWVRHGVVSCRSTSTAMPQRPKHNAISSRFASGPPIATRESSSGASNAASHQSPAGRDLDYDSGLRRPS